MITGNPFAHNPGFPSSAVSPSSLFESVTPISLCSEAYYFLNTNMSRASYAVLKDKSELNVRDDFPILQRKVNGRPLIWLDNAATTQKPLSVINALNQYYKEYNSNVHRGAHTLARIATEAYEAARDKVRMFLGATESKEIIFVRGATEGINLIAESYGRCNFKAGDEVLVSEMEHHSNIVPWQKLRDEIGVVIKTIPFNKQGEIELSEYGKRLSPRTKLVALTHVSNALGTVNPVKTMAEMAHQVGAMVLIDGAQATPHMPVNVKELDADFYVLSGHKLYGPTGIGAVYGKRVILEAMPPWQQGGGMIEEVNFDRTLYKGIPEKFEAGTGNIAGAIGLGAAIDYLNKMGMSTIERHEKRLTEYAVEKLSKIPNLSLIGTAANKMSVISFVMKGMQPENLAGMLDKYGIAVRAGHHCAQPALNRFGLNSTVRASIGLYNSQQEIDYLSETIKKLSNGIG